MQDKDGAESARFGSTYTKIGTIQRRLAWPLRKDDTQIREAFHIFKARAERPSHHAVLTAGHGVLNKDIGHWVETIPESVDDFPLWTDGSFQCSAAGLALRGSE